MECTRYGLNKQTTHGEDQLPLRKAVQWVIDTAHDLWQITKAPVQKAANAVKERWQPPDEWWIKCNVDGAFYSESGQGATGAVLRNDAGSFEAGRAKLYSHCLE